MSEHPLVVQIDAYFAKKGQPPSVGQMRDEIARLHQWCSDLQSGMYVNCVYCGHRYGPRETTPVAMADALKAHAAQCPEHPMSALLAACKAALPEIDKEIVQREASGLLEYVEPMKRVAAQMREAVAKVQP